MSDDPAIEGLLRELAPQVLGALVRRHGQFDACEDAVQEALLSAATEWPRDGEPDDPRAWLTTVATRRLIDEWRSESARRRREESAAALEPPSLAAPEPAAGDDTLALLFMCAHPSLSAPSKLALTLRAVGGLSTAEIASAFLVPEATMAQRISRAKATVRKAGASFELPPPGERAERLRVVTQVLYLIFNEGYVASSGQELQRTDLTREAIRLTRLLHALLPEEGEVAGLLALMVLTEARSAARTDAVGLPVPLADQDRSLWDAAAIEEGVALVSSTLGRGPTGPYQLQAAIAAIHDEAAGDEETDWPQIMALYGLLERIAPSPLVTLGRAVAVGRVEGPRAGLALLGTLEEDERMTNTHRLESVRGHLLELAGDPSSARASYLAAARACESAPERDWLLMRAAELA